MRFGSLVRWFVNNYWWITSLENKASLFKATHVSIYIFILSIRRGSYIRARTGYESGTGRVCKMSKICKICRFVTNITLYPKKYAHGFCFAVLRCGYTLTDFPISIRLTSLALWQSNDCPSASKATLMNMDKYFMWIHYERLHNHNKAKHNKTVCIFLGIYCIWHLIEKRLCQLTWVMRLTWHIFVE